MDFVCKDKLHTFSTMLHWPNRKFITLLEVMVAVSYLLEAVVSSFMAPLSSSRLSAVSGLVASAG